MGFFEKKVNRRLAGFLLGTTAAVAISQTEQGRSIRRRAKDFFKSGIKEMEKEFGGTTGIEKITVKKDTKKDNDKFEDPNSPLSQV